MKNSMLIAVWIVAVIIGTVIEHSFQIHGVPQTGVPKNELPQTGSVLRVEAVFDDGSFVAIYAGSRLYYKAPKGKIQIEAGRAYEITDQQIQNGGHQKMLLAIMK